MKLPSFELHRPGSLEEALGLRTALGSDAKVLAGGQSLLPMMRYRMMRPYALIDISGVAGLDALAAGESVRIGALVTHADIEDCAHDGPLFSLLRAHAREIAFLPVRNKGTVVGSLVHADPAADWPLLFCALGAIMEIASQRGRRHVAIADFIQGALDTDVRLDEIVTAAILPPRAADMAGWGRYKLMHRVGEYAEASALAIKFGDGSWACWAGAIDPKPLQLPGVAEALRRASGHPPAGLADEAAQEILACRPHCGELAAARHGHAVLRAALMALEETP